MVEAVFSVLAAGPLVTIQDKGRPGHMRYGVAMSGPMDRVAFEAAHAALGNPAGSSAIEISLGGLVLQCTQATVTIAVTGGDFIVEHAGQRTQSWSILTLTQGERLSIRAGKAGSWAYLAFAGTLQSPSWLGSHATHAASTFGGGIVASGQSITIYDAAVRDDRLGDISQPDFMDQGPFRVVTGPQDHHFAPQAIAQFLSQPFKVTDAYDRMGMRLNGPTLALNDALSIPSEPIVRGSVQVSGDGVASVLLADHQTTGGYPKIATVISCDTDRLAQTRAGEAVKFIAISAQQAISVVREFATHETKYTQQISTVRGTLEQRLMRENLIHGFNHDEIL